MAERWRSDHTDQTLRIADTRERPRIAPPYGQVPDGFQVLAIMVEQPLAQPPLVDPDTDRPINRCQPMLRRVARCMTVLVVLTLCTNSVRDQQRNNAYRFVDAVTMVTQSIS